ncbi:MAG: VCBS repeat-containing protein, partial [Gemmatimonadota bacterium]|nr:VCBS repeat-containing protein [Gemmatimonadota bacterium]
MTALCRRPGTALAVLVLSACGPADFSGPIQPAEWTALADGARWRPLAVPAGGGPGFTAIPPSWSGVSFANRLNEDSMIENQMLTNGSGVALADVDGDGRIDLFFARLDGANVLYRNLGDWRFEDVTAGSGLAAEDRFSTGGVFADVDGDGDPDLILTAVGGGTSLYRNDGAGRFAVDPEAGLDPASGAMSAALADIDADGDLDLYVTNYKDRWARDAIPPAERAYDRVEEEEDGRFSIRPGFEDYFRVIRTDEGWQRWEFAQRDEAYRTEGGRFEEISFTGGVFRDEAGRPLERAPDEWGLAARFADFDLDGDPDLYVCNDINSPDHIWVNDGRGG